MIDIDTSWEWIAMYGPVQYSTVQYSTVQYITRNTWKHLEEEQDQQVEIQYDEDEV